MTPGNASNWEMQVDKRRSLSLERDMARDSSVRSGNVAALTAWQRSSDEGNKTGEPQLAWSPRLGDVVSLGIFTVKLAATTADFPRLFSDTCPLLQSYQSSQHTSSLNATRYIVPFAKVWQSRLDLASAVLHTCLKGSTAGLQMQLFGSISGRRLDRFLPRHLRRTSPASVIQPDRSC